LDQIESYENSFEYKTIIVTLSKIHLDDIGKSAVPFEVKKNLS
jgi:hypothetical protein